MKPTNRGYMTVCEAAKMSGVSNAIAYTAIRTGKLEAEIIDGRYMVRPEAVKAWRDNTRDRSGALFIPLGQQMALNFRVSRDMYADIAQVARARHMTMSGLARKAIQKQIEEEQKNG